MAAACVPDKSVNVIKTICTLVLKTDYEELAKVADAHSDLFIYEECGLSSAIIYDANPPLYLLVHPLRPFRALKVRFESAPSYRSENPFVILAKKTESESYAELPDYKTSIGFSLYTRDYWAQRCHTKDGAPVIVAAANTRTADGLYLGSNIIAVKPSLLQSSEVQKLASKNLLEADERALLKSFSEKIIRESLPQISAALNVPQNLVERALLTHLEKDHYSRYKTEITNPAAHSGSSVIGFIQSDLEHAIALSEEIRSFEETRGFKPYNPDDNVSGKSLLPWLMIFLISTLIPISVFCFKKIRK